ncbi:uncharacterized protein LOC135701768 [Ochlerotatus camptorhynchus]|uniref:uncharacterized protein LOC135701768 n=1 Tax=Ochlerotatus camptorhynchus TaxID=644619 RepID=UPI0031E07B11
MNLLYLIIFIHIYFNHQILCYRSAHGSGRKMAERNSRNNAKSRKDDRFSDNYVYSTDYSPSESGTYYEDDGDYDSLRNSREEKDTSDGTGHYDIENLNAFSDDEVSLALSMLTEHELDKLDRLIDDNDQQDAGEMMTKREIDKTQKRKRECHGESCLQAERDGARAVRGSNTEKDQLASFRSWFSRNKTTKTTRRTTTTRKPSVRTSKTRTPTKPTKKSPSTKIIKGREPQRYLPDNSNILRYGSNKGARDMIDKNVREKINFLTRKIKRRADQKSEDRLSVRGRKAPLHHTGMNRQQETSIRRKRNSIVSGTRGTLEDSFPHPSHETASFHAPMEPLVRVKRGPVAI